MLDETHKEVNRRIGLMVHLKRNLNGLCIIHRLPLEIFSRIMLFTGPPSIQNLTPYLKLTWVCHRWRKMLVEDSRFWNLMFLGVGPFPEEFYQTMLWRMQTRPLHLVIIDQSFYMTQQIKCLQLDKVQVDSLCIDRPSLLYFDLSIFFSSSLRRFIFLNPLTISWQAEGFLPLLANCENLEFLQFPLTEKMPLDLLGRVFERLQCLSVFFHSNSLDFVVSILSLLQGSAKLKELYAQSFLWQGDGKAWKACEFPQGLAIHLPELEYLKTDYGFALETIRAPKVSYFGVTTPLWPSDRGQGLMEGFDFSFMGHLSVKTYSRHHASPICVSASPPQERPMCVGDEDFAELTREFHDGLRQVQQRGYHLELFGHLDKALEVLIPLSPRLVFLELLADPAAYDLQWLLRSAPFLRKLVILGEDPLEFIELFRDTSLLKHLQCLLYTFRPKQNGGQRYGNQVGETLVDCLQSRERANVHKLELMHWHNCSPFDNASLEQFKRLSPKV